MAYILTCENCIGQCAKLSMKDGNIIAEPYGKQVNGVLALQQPEKGSDKLRITFIDAGNLLRGIFESLLPWTDPLCHFDFNEQELRTGEKMIRCVRHMTIIPPFTYMLECYDGNNASGRGYIFPDEESLKMWAVEIGITEMDTQDIDGNVIETEQF